MKSKEFTAIRTFSNYNEAALQKSLLDSAGIDSMLSNEAMNSVYPSLEWTPVNLIVRSEDADKAEQILNAKFDRKEYQENYL